MRIRYEGKYSRGKWQKRRKTKEGKKRKELYLKIDKSWGNTWSSMYNFPGQWDFTGLWGLRVVSTCPPSLCSGRGACLTVSQVSPPGQSCPTLCQGDGLSGNWPSFWLLFPGVFPYLFRGSGPTWPQPNLWARAENLHSALFNKPSGINSLHFCRCPKP